MIVKQSQSVSCDDYKLVALKIYALTTKVLLTNPCGDTTCNYLDALRITVYAIKSERRVTKWTKDDARDLSL